MGSAFRFGLLLSLIIFCTPFSFATEPHGSEEKKEMGPAAFLWPPDRKWDASSDNTEPCGSNTGVVNRTDFPQRNGAIALVVQDESYNISVSIAYGNNNPRSQSSFTPQFSRNETEIKPGHVCYPLPNMPDDIGANFNATIQVRYVSDFFTNKNDTFYVCADIRYVDDRQFTTQIPCFNVTSDDFVPVPASKSGATSISGSGIQFTLLLVLAIATGAILSFVM